MWIVPYCLCLSATINIQWQTVCLGTVDNHGNMEITENVIFVKCQMLPKCHVFCQNAVFTRIFVFNRQNLKFIA